MKEKIGLKNMTEFENWLESGEYKRYTKNHKIDVSVEHTDGSYKIEFKNILDFAEVCFNKGFDKGELHTTLKGGGFLFSLHRLNLHNQPTSD